jgi:protein MAK16
MHNDETLWHVLNHSYCSHKVKLGQANIKQNFCRNPHNVTGLCNRVSCPLANSQYATVMEEEGISYLYIKTVERAHSPKNLWEKVKLSRNYLQALEQISKHLEYWPDHMVNRCKQRLTKIRQMLIRMRKLSMREGPRLVPIKKKTERREKVRELKAEAAAKVDLAIEKELLERLKQGTYGDIYNFPQKRFDSVMDKQKQKEEEEELEDESETEFVEDLGEDDEDLDGEEEEEEQVEQVELEDLAADGDLLRDLEDLGDDIRGLPPRKKRPRVNVPRVELEYENEMESR